MLAHANDQAPWRGYEGIIYLFGAHTGSRSKEGRAMRGWRVEVEIHASFFVRQFRLLSNLSTCYNQITTYSSDGRQRKSNLSKCYLLLVIYI